MFGLFENKKQDYTAEINSAARMITVKPGNNLLKSALAANLAWPHDCRVGSCGTCKCRLVEGKIKPLADFSYVLEGDELQDGYILACQTALKSDVKVEVELLVESREVHHWETEAVITRVKDLTHDIKEIVIEIKDPERLAKKGLLYKAGQYADLKLSHLDDGRSYSFANAPKAGQKEFHFYIRKVPGGEFTSWLFDEDPMGQTLDMSGPYGCFGLSEYALPMICVAGGSGMSAIICILQDAIQTGIKRDVRFLFGARSQADLYCDELIGKIAASWESQGLGKFEYIPCLSEEPAGTSWKGKRGFVTEFIVNGSDKDMSAQAYLCGPPGMIDAGIDVLEKNGLNRSAIFFDKFLDKSNTQVLVKD